MLEEPSSMEALIAVIIGVLTACGVYLALRARTFPLVIGLTLLSYAVNVFLFVTGRLTVGLPAVISDQAVGYADPLPQALVLTAIVISFGMTAFLIMLALKARAELGTDQVDGRLDARDAPEGRARMSHLVIAPVLFPLFAATLMLLVRRIIPLRVRRGLNLVALVVQILLVSLLAQRVAGGEILVYALGNWPAPYGIVMVADRLSVWMLLDHQPARLLRHALCRARHGCR
jgi:multicomponent K+:H+ antiporter subunit C